MFKKWKEKKEKEEFFKKNSINDLFLELVTKMTIIKDAIKAKDYLLLNEFTGLATNMLFTAGRYFKVKSIFLANNYGFIVDSNEILVDPIIEFKKGQSINEKVFDIITGTCSYDNGKFIENNFKDIYWQFKKYEKKFPESLLLRFQFI